MAADPALLDELFPEGDYRFHLTLRRGELGAFLTAWDPSGRLLDERRQLAQARPDRHLAQTARGLPAVEAFQRLASEKGLPPFNDVTELAQRYEPDLLFLVPDPLGRFILEAGALCFPTGWGLDQKLGQPMDGLHGAVPGLNAALGAPISAFLSRLKPGQSMERRNWGIVGSEALNRHPDIAFAPLGDHEPLNALWLRIEHQLLVGLDGGSVLFGIRIDQRRLDAFCAEALPRERLAQALATMPEPMAAYKGLALLRAPLADRLASGPVN